MAVRPNSALDLYKDGLWMPLLKDWYEDEEKLAMWTDSPARPEGYQGALVDMSLNHVVAVEADYVSNFDQMDAIIEPALETVWMGTATAEDASQASTWIPCWKAHDALSTSEIILPRFLCSNRTAETAWGGRNTNRPPQALYN